MKKKVFFCLIISIVMIVFSGCSSNSFIERNETCDLIVPIELQEAMEKKVEQVQALPELTLQFLPLDISAVYAQLSAVPEKSLQRESVSYPDNKGGSETLYSGKLPFYDIYLNIETISGGTSIYYETQSYSYLSAIFEPCVDAAQLNSSALTFAEISEAREELETLAEQLGVRLVDLSCKSLSMDTLQSLYDGRKASGTLRDIRYTTSASPFDYKNASAVADKPSWAKEDECYYFSGRVGFFDTPIFGSSFEAYINSTGILNISAIGLQQIKAQKKPKRLKSGKEILSKLGVLEAGQYSQNGAVLTDAQLTFYPLSLSEYAPVWILTLEYPFTTPENETETRTAQVLLHACTANEIIEEDVIM